ncbi:protein-export chaperone SecB [Alkalicoccobacillus plakortidis]|uniref:Protein-export chaperone SecB n=1 Tax=Alkalicoccobacillus plakortidis TaxID=444060 RepID=A0ABT0XDU9_9BACI|nr:protein-export chaperone SecB [Alkalicoccobacillus plakortidis]MCM2674074.1 protein-export chaperone SecB [Alkalicoccobacillus plakortidis]
MKASLNFENYFVLETFYFNNPFPPETDEEESDDLTPQFKWNIQHRDKENLTDAGVFLEVLIGDKDEGHFCVEAHVLGLFTIEDNEIENDEKERLYKINAIAILFPYLRSLVSDLTSKGNSADQIILPPLNIHSMMEQELEN